MSNLILICGLSGSGKTTLAKNIIKELIKHNENVSWLNADKIRKDFNDWDFSIEGRKRQASRIKKLSKSFSTRFVICDFIAPTKTIRNEFDADYVIFMNTTQRSKYLDTDELFEIPNKWNYCFESFNDYNKQIQWIINSLLCIDNNHEVLPNLNIRALANIKEMYSGMDTPELCHDIKLFNRYSKEINYIYNNRGFRDGQWPKDLSDCIWCFGDSGALGLGQPHDETWPKLIQKHTEKRTINVSLIGSSNEWLAHRALEVLKEFNTATVVIQWTFLSRRLINNENVHLDHNKLKNLSEEEFIQDNFLNFKKCFELIESVNTANIIHLFIPNILNNISDMDTFFNFCQNNVNGFMDCFAVRNNIQLDLARDGFHYGFLTSDNYAVNASNFIKKLNNLY